MSRFLLLAVSGMLGLMPALHADERRWPEQKAARELLVIDSGLLKDGRTANPANAMLAQSLSGLAAQAVNEGRGDQLLWIAPRGSKSYVEWQARLLKRTGMQKKKVSDLWQVVADFRAQGIVKGYVLYRAETKERDQRAVAERGKPGDSVDESCNAATVLSGLLQGVLIEESLEDQARAAGLALLYDARKTSEQEIFDKYKDQLNPRAVLVQSPDFPYMRDLAIAHRMMVCFGTESPTPEVYRWMKPIGSVFGWNAGDERAAVLQATREGHVVVPCDWALNVPALSVGVAEALAGLPKFQMPPAAPASQQPGVALVMSDGDNLQWMLTSFTHNANYWANEQRTKFPFVWGLPVADLIHLAPDVYHYLVETQGGQTSILCHFGYWYPDRFAEDRGDQERRTLLEELGKQCEQVFRHTGTHFLTFLADDLGSASALESYEILAQASPSMKGMFGIGYDPYEGGEGKTYWVESAAGGRIPMTTAAYALWQTASRKRPHAGTPEVLSRKIIEDATPGSVNWVIIHAWSEFDPPAGVAKFLGVGPTNQLADLLQGRVDILSAESFVARLHPSEH